MERAVIIDGTEHSWEEPGVITLKASNQAMERTAREYWSHNAVIRVYDDAGNVIETREHAGDFKEP